MLRRDCLARPCYPPWRVRIWWRWDRGIQIGPVSLFLRTYDEGRYLLIVWALARAEWWREVMIWKDARS